MDNKTILERGVTDIIVRENLEKKLKSGKKLRIKFGIDPTGSAMHIGHAVPLRKLKQFQDAGHTAILLIGDYTARIGDPTGKSETRKMLTEKEIKENMKTYIEQASKILNIKKVEIRYNSEWFAKMSMADILGLTAKKTVQQMLQREDFKNRLKQNQDVSIVELLYPLMQGYDSVMLNCDVEIGGVDQIFNMLVGRDMQRAYGSKIIQDVLTVPILEGTDGVEKMSKTFNNYIGLLEAPKEIFGKTMSVHDELILKYFELATEVPTEEIRQIKKSLEAGENPRNIKVKLAKELVTLYHDRKSADIAAEEFEKLFKKKEIPEDIAKKTFKDKSKNIIDLLAESGLATSKSEARHLIEGGGVKVNGQKVTDIKLVVDLGKEALVQVGKRKFLKCSTHR